MWLCVSMASELSPWDYAHMRCVYDCLLWLVAMVAILLIYVPFLFCDLLFCFCVMLLVRPMCLISFCGIWDLFCQLRYFCAKWSEQNVGCGAIAIAAGPRNAYYLY